MGANYLKWQLLNIPEKYWDLGIPGINFSGS